MSPIGNKGIGVPFGREEEPGFAPSAWAGATLPRVLAGADGQNETEKEGGTRLGPSPLRGCRGKGVKAGGQARAGIAAAVARCP